MTETKLERKTLGEWREDVGVTQRELAELAGYGRGVVRRIENGSVPISGPSAQRIAEVLGIRVEQIVRPGRKEIDTSWWPDDGFSKATPTESLQWWRERRALTQEDLAAISGISLDRIYRIEKNQGNRTFLSTRRKLAAALRVYPGKLLLPGDKGPAPEQVSVETILRAELRGKTRALKRVHDFLIDDSNLTFKAQDARDVLLRDIGPELKGL